MTSTRTVTLLAIAAFSAGMPPDAVAQVATPVIQFESSGAPEAHRHLLTGIEALHNFWYEEAIAQFRAAQRIDPDFVLAYWGEALAYHQPFGFSGSQLDSMRAVLDRLAPTTEQRRVKAKTDREREYLAALEILAGDGDVADRHRGFARAMERLASAHPGDQEARAFYVLSLYGTVESLRRDSMLREEAAAQALTILDVNPTHPGALHYLIHALDNPSTAHRALDAANVYAGIVPDAPHAIHMPSHIYVQHGMWDAVVKSNQRAYAVSDDWVRDEKRSLDDRDYHALGWLPYARLQQGRYREAWATVDLIREAVEETNSGNLRWYYAEYAATHLVETEDWGALAVPTSGYNNRAEFYAKGANAIETGDVETARSVLQRVAENVERNTERSGESSIATVKWRIVHHQLAGLLARVESRGEDALTAMREAVRLEGLLPPPNEIPDPVKPPRELLGETLLALDRPHDAIEAFELALLERPGRARALLGLARAHAAAGDERAARSVYRRLATQWSQADATVPALAEVRRWTSPGPDAP